MELKNCRNRHGFMSHLFMFRFILFFSVLVIVVVLLLLDTNDSMDTCHYTSSNNIQINSKYIFFLLLFLVFNLFFSPLVLVVLSFFHVACYFVYFYTFHRYLPHYPAIFIWLWRFLVDFVATSCIYGCVQVESLFEIKSECTHFAS